MIQEINDFVQKHNKVIILCDDQNVNEIKEISVDEMTEMLSEQEHSLSSIDVSIEYFSQEVKKDFVRVLCFTQIKQKNHLVVHDDSGCQYYIFVM